MQDNKVVVIGLDGSSWDLVNLLIQQGRLPNLARMQQQGVAATLYSTHPAHSAPAWTTFATGVPPTEHGCLDFLVVRHDIDDLDIIDSTKIKQETIYETMVRHGKKPILINLPNTFPPKLRDHITITSLMTRGDQYIYPESLKTKYPALQRYRLSPNAKLRAQNRFDPYVADVVQLERDRIAGAKELFLHEPWDFFFFLSSGTDWISHVVYEQALRQNYEPAYTVWQVMDEFIGWLLAHMDDVTTLFVMSDHGFKVYDDIFYMNRWLEQAGLLQTTTGTGSFQQEHTKLSQEVGKVQQRRVQLRMGKGLRRLLAASPAAERFSKKVYERVIKKYLPVNVTVNLKLDLAHTSVAFPRGSMASMLYVNDTGRFHHGIIAPADRARLTEELQQRLAAITDRSGQPVIKQVSTPQELYGQQVGPLAPDLFLSAERYYLSGSLHASSLFEHAAKNYHDDRGMMLAFGAGIAPRPIADNTILNFAPTIMHTLGLPVQEQYTGTVMDIFASAWAASHPVQHEAKQEHFALTALVDELAL